MKVTTPETQEAARQALMYEEILSLRLGRNPAGFRTVKDLLYGLLSAFWNDPEHFDPAQPFGWSLEGTDVFEDVYRAMVRGGFLVSAFSETGRTQGKHLILLTIQHMQSR